MIEPKKRIFFDNVSYNDRKYNDRKTFQMKNFRKTIFSLLCCCFCAIVSAQTSRIDSLEQVLATGKLNHQEKATILLSLSHAYLHIDTAKCRLYAMDGLQLALNNGFKFIEGNAYARLGNFYSNNYLHYQELRQLL